MNALEEPQAIKALYRASQAGVQIDLIVRGICCLRPGVPGLSDNIRVRCIIDRFLEHSRAYYFENNGNPEIYCGSSDWMPRNFFRRVEVVYPVEDKDLQQRMLNEVLLPALADNTKARLIQSDGSHRRATRGASEKPLRYQQWLIQQATRSNKEKPPADLLGVRPVASPGLSAAQVLRPVRVALSPPSADGRAGTSADPVLQSLQQSLSSEDEPPLNGIPHQPEENSNGKKTSKAVKSLQPKEQAKA
jgi:polyphosphate kinase